MATTARSALRRVGLGRRLIDLDIERQLNGQIIRTYQGLAVIHPVTVAFGAAVCSARRRLRAGAQARRLIAAQHTEGISAGMHYRKSDLHQTNATKCYLGSFAGMNT
jgi:hypothetical protein